VTSWEASLVDGAQSITGARGELSSLASGVAGAGNDAPEAPTLATIEAGVREALADATRSLEQAEQELHNRRSPAGAIARGVEKWRQAYQQFETAYGLAKQRSAAHESQLETLAGLENRQKGLRAQLASQRDELRRVSDPATRHRELRDEWMSVRRERSDLLSKQCQDLTALSNGLIGARLGRGTEFDSLLQRFKTAISGSGLRTNKIDAVFDRVKAAEDTLGAWEEMTEELERVLLASDDASAKQWTPRSALAALSAAELERIRPKLTLEDVLEMSLSTPGDRPSFEYRIREGEYIPFEVASAGQQATALLRVLLNQPGPPLVIDQPEDDLDSKSIVTVVDDIWKSKMWRQLIFSSHNANLVVNGDAELVVCCDYRAIGDQSRGQIKLTGAIDIQEVRDEITTVMEGGEKAFRLRKEKYGF
jgi:chromosome segregation protein